MKIEGGGEGDRWGKSKAEIGPVQLVDTWWSYFHVSCRYFSRQIPGEHPEFLRKFLFFWSVFW